MKEVELTAVEQPAIPENWKAVVARYQRPSVTRGVYQIVNTLVPYALLWVAMYVAKAVSWWLVVPLAVLAAGFLVRLFIIHHDCGHGSFFRSRRANDTVGFITGVLTFTPYATGAGNTPSITRRRATWTVAASATSGR